MLLRQTSLEVVRVMAKLNKPSATSKLMALMGQLAATPRPAIVSAGEGRMKLLLPSELRAAIKLPARVRADSAGGQAAVARMTQYEISRTAFRHAGAMIFDGPNPVTGHQTRTRSV